MDNADAVLFYDGENEFAGNAYQPDSEYEYEYEDMEGETLSELYQYCLSPTIFDTFSYMIPLFAAAFVSRLLSQSHLPSYKVYHVLTMLIGVYVVQHYAYECLYVLMVFVILSYAALYLPKKYRKGLGVFLPSLCIICYCEFSMQPVVWHKIRSLVMTMAMKSISVASDTVDSNVLPDFYSYAGYMFCAVTGLFGPWTSYKDYISLRHSEHQNQWWILAVIACGFGSFFFLSVSNCGTQWNFSNNAWKWSVAYRDALAFRMSHYFISYAASTVLLLGGYPFSLVNIVKPLEIEFPRSLVQVVISWNIPMHFWLKTYIFRPSIKQLGKFGAVTVTYAMSSLLHGLNFQLAAVLLSLGLYTYIEFQLRTMLAETFDACITSKQCTKPKCTHKYNAQNCWWVNTINVAFSLLAVFHLAYLGLMFDTSELQETGYSYRHTVEKWSELGFASHWVALGTYCIYLLMK